MNTHPKIKEFKSTIMRAMSSDRPLFFPHILMPKYDGLWAMWTGSEFISKSGKRWNGAVVRRFIPHNLPDVKLTGEFWIPNSNLGAVTSAVGIMRDDEGPGIENVQYVVHDVVNNSRAQDRIAAIHEAKAKKIYPPTWQPVKARIVKSLSEHEEYREYFLESVSPEGVMLLHPQSRYEAGLSNTFWKIKVWQKDEFTVELKVEGEGKYAGTLGALQCITAAGVPFEVGSFEISDARRDELWHELKQGDRVIVKYKEFSKTGVPIGGILQELETAVE